VDEKKGLESLLVWQRAIKFAVHVCKTVLPLFPEQEKYSLSSQLRRSVQSIPANIAEGFGRYYYLDAVHFCLIARGSLEESFSHLTLAKELNYLKEDDFHTLKEELGEIRKMLDGYINFLRKRKLGETEAKRVIREGEEDYEASIPDRPIA
jgi:four helix bundle protein